MQQHTRPRDSNRDERPFRDRVPAAPSTERSRPLPPGRPSIQQPAIEHRIAKPSSGTIRTMARLERSRYRSILAGMVAAAAATAQSRTLPPASCHRRQPSRPPTSTAMDSPTSQWAFPWKSSGPSTRRGPSTCSTGPRMGSPSRPRSFSTRTGPICMRAPKPGTASARRLQTAISTATGSPTWR